MKQRGVGGGEWKGGVHSGKNERAICQCDSTSKSHRNARSSCSMGRIKPLRRSISAPCIALWVYSVALTHISKIEPQLSSCCQQPICLWILNTILYSFPLIIPQQDSYSGRMMCCRSLGGIHWMCLPQVCALLCITVSQRSRWEDYEKKMCLKKNSASLIFHINGCDVQTDDDVLQQISLLQCLSVSVGTTRWAHFAPE